MRVDLLWLLRDKILLENKTRVDLQKEGISLATEGYIKYNDAQGGGALKYTEQGAV